MKFDPETLYIPDVNYKTAKFLGAPLVPPFRIQIKPVKLEVIYNASCLATMISIGITVAHAADLCRARSTELLEK